MNEFTPNFCDLVWGSFKLTPDLKLYKEGLGKNISHMIAGFKWFSDLKTSIISVRKF